MTARARLAPAKVNLFLHVGPPEGGYHPLVSLMTFADLGDRLTCAPAQDQSLAVRGPFAAGLSVGEDNLVTRAVRAALAAAGRPGAGYAMVLDKRLPLAAGIGGGSSDAGAALRLIDETLDLGLGEAALQHIAAGLGADGAACLRARPVLAEGRGERLSAPPAWPVLPCVLVNPGVPSSTPRVFAAYDALGAFASVESPPLTDLSTVEAVAEALAMLRNDLQPAALSLDPRIAEPLEALSAAPQTLLARLSGSGATSFALCADLAAAEALASGLAQAHPRWWVRACTLG